MDLVNSTDVVNLVIGLAVLAFILYRQMQVRPVKAGPGNGPIGDQLPSALAAIPQSKSHALAILDMVTLNGDRHGDNVGSGQRCGDCAKSKSRASDVVEFGDGTGDHDFGRDSGGCGAIFGAIHIRPDDRPD